MPPAKSVMPQLAEILDVDLADLDALRPGGSGEVRDEPHESNGGGPSTIEQPPIPVSDEPSVVSHDVAQAGSQRGVLGDLGAAWRSLTEDWTGWIRGLATVGVLLLLLVVLVWAASELMEALGDVWDSFDAGS